MDCYDRDGRKGDSTSIDSLGNCIGAYSEAQGGESVEYTYDSSILVQGFLRSDSYKNPYLLLFNSGTSDLSIHIQTDTPFTLPVLTITTEARKGNSLQSIKYQEDRSKYYDALRYGIYNKN